MQRALVAAEKVGGKVAEMEGELSTALFPKEVNFPMWPVDSNDVFPNKIVYGNGIYIAYNLSTFGAADTDDRYYYYVKTSDESSWGSRIRGSYSKIVFFKNVFVGLNDYSNVYPQYSTNGKNWIKITLPGNTYFSGEFVDAGDALYLVGKTNNDDSSNPFDVYKTTDGKNYTQYDTSTWDISDDRIYSILYSKNFNRFYMVSGYSYSGGQTRYNLRTSTDFKTWTSVSGTNGGTLLELGDKVYQTYYRNFGAGTILTESYCTVDGTTWQEIFSPGTSSSSDSTITPTYYFDGKYFAMCQSEYGDFYYYSVNGIDDWVTISDEDVEVFPESPSICNGMCFFYNNPSSTTYLRQGISFDGLNYYRELHSFFYDRNKGNKTGAVASQFTDAYQELLDAAYTQGVNAYQGE